MSRRHAAKKREILPDPKFHNLVLAKFMNCIMESGKKSVAERIVYGALEIIATKSKADPIVFFQEALDKLSLRLRSNPAGSAVPPIRCRLKSARRARRLLPCAG